MPQSRFDKILDRLHKYGCAPCREPGKGVVGLVVPGDGGPTDFDVLTGAEPDLPEPARGLICKWMGEIRAQEALEKELRLPWCVRTVTHLLRKLKAGRNPLPFASMEGARAWGAIVNVLRRDYGGVSYESFQRLLGRIGCERNIPACDLSYWTVSQLANATRQPENRPTRPEVAPERRAAAPAPRRSKRPVDLPDTHGYIESPPDPEPVDRLKPSHAKAKALYEWATENIDGADEMTYAELFDKLQSDPRCAGEGLPDNAEAFARYCRAAGVQRNTPRRAKGPTRSIRRASDL